MKPGVRIADFCLRHYRFVAIAAVVVTLGVGALGGLPSVIPGGGKYFNQIKVDTDPENMLDADEPVRVRHDRMKETFGLYDMIVVGVVNETDPNGVFNPDSLARIYELTEFAKSLQGDVIGAKAGEGVVEVDVIAPSTVDSIEPGSMGQVKFEWLMPQPPDTQKEALEIRRKAMRIPFLNDTLVSEDGKAIAIYLPITRKDLSYTISSRLQEKIAEFEGEDEFHITGLPVAEDTFGVEMFKQMAISAPAAMGVIFILMLVFFRKLVLIISPMIVALLTVIFAMGLLVISGFPIHIMSSMIPIFIMPIAVLDSIHIISEFFDQYPHCKDRSHAMKGVMDALFMPMLYTSLTSSAGFASLALTPIPPVQVFGVYVAIGIMMAWALTITFIPAFVMFIPEKRLENFGAEVHEHTGEAHGGWLGKFLRWMGKATYRRAKPIIALTVVVIVLAGWGISKIVVNDNPTKWFEPDHPIRVADRVLNDHFGGTYMAYLALDKKQEQFDPQRYVKEFQKAAEQKAGELRESLPAADGVFNELVELARKQAGQSQRREEFFAGLSEAVEKKSSAAGGEKSFAWDEASLFVDAQQQMSQVFKDPDVLKYQLKLKDTMLDTGVVGKTNSLATIVKTVHRDLVSGPDPAEQKKNFRIPERRQMVAECLLQFQSSHRPGDLWHFVTPDYRTSSMWVQLTSGDNRDMSKVVRAVNDYIAENPPPDGLEHKWFGLTYINVVWQEKMVWGMLGAFGGSFLVVFLLMTVLFRSALWGLLSMIPLTVTIAAIYGAIGHVGKYYYDMPVAVLSSLTLGLAVDFAIHFLSRARHMRTDYRSWRKTSPAVFGEPARAIARNIIVIAVGFLPLLLAPLVPYQTVGMLMAAILLVSGVATLLILPAMVRLLENRLFVEHKVMGATCNCATCAATALAITALIAINLHGYMEISIGNLTWISIGVVTAMAIICGVLSRRQKCRVIPRENKNENEKDN